MRQQAPPVKRNQVGDVSCRRVLLKHHAPALRAQAHTQLLIGEEADNGGCQRLGAGIDQNAGLPVDDAVSQPGHVGRHDGKLAAEGLESRYAQALMQRGHEEDVASRENIGHVVPPSEEMAALGDTQSRSQGPLRGLLRAMPNVDVVRIRHEPSHQRQALDDQRVPLQR